MNQQSKLDIVDENYQNTLIYGIICMITGEIYVGSTTQTLNDRIAGHIQKRCSAWQILERGNYKAYEIQHWPCNTKREMLTLEGQWQKAYKACFPEHFVNKRIEGAFRTDSPEVMQAYDTQYYKEHKEQKKAKMKKHYKEHKEEKRVYREEHKEQKKEYDKQNNKLPWTCDWCNKTMTQGNRSRHKKICKSKPPS
jgi:hypothetical protein